MSKVSIKPKDQGCETTKFALLWMNLASEPLIALYTLLPFILRKELGASVLQLSLFVMLRPLLSVFSFYWSAFRKRGLVSNLIGACILANLPFVFFPFVDNVWLLLGACAVYQLFSRAGTPALIEILKQKIPEKPRAHIFSLYFILSFIESGILGMVVGNLLDNNTIPWKYLFLIGALIGLSSVLIQRRIALPKEKIQDAEVVKNPLRSSFALLRARPDFARFQWGFMFGGFALMLMAPALSIFYADTLALSYESMTVARYIFMGIGVALSSMLWKRGLQSMQIHRVTGWVLLGFGLFPVTLLAASWNPLCLYGAFFTYGIAQAGSHLLWNLSGTVFAREEDSSPYTAVNLLMLGLRGIVAPFLGGILCDLWGPLYVLIAGALICFTGMAYMLQSSRVWSRASF